MGYGIESIVLANLGTVPINLSDVVFTSSVVSTTTPVSPLLGENVNAYSGLVITLGQALGCLNSNFMGPRDPSSLAQVQAISQQQ
jgi:hypothetical protein